MRPDRFEAFAVSLIRNAPTPAVKGVQTFRDAGVQDSRYGAVVRLASGAEVQWQFVAQSRPGDNFQHPEEIFEGAPVEPVVIPDLQMSGRIATADVEAWFAALVASSESPEISGYEPWSHREDNRSGHVGVTVAFHSGAKIYAGMARAARAGDINDQQWFTPLKEVQS